MQYGEQKNSGSTNKPDFYHIWTEYLVLICGRDQNFHKLMLVTNNSYKFMLAYVYIVYHLHCLIVHLKIG